MSIRSLSTALVGSEQCRWVTIGGGSLTGTADLVDTSLGLVIEAESGAYHGGRDAFDRDVRRYPAMVRAGWVVLRFLWDDVRHDPDQVRTTLADAVARLTVGRV